VINKEPDELSPPLHRSNYALDIHKSSDENLPKTSIEQNIKGFIDSCVRSSIHDISHANRDTGSKLIYTSI
jgi:hypothetical protein